MRYVFMVGVLLVCTNCSGRVNPIDALPGSEYYVGEYPNVFVHASNPPRPYLTPEQLEVAKNRLKNKR